MQEVSLVASAITAVVAGILSFLSPCVLPLMPAYLSYVSGVSLQDLQGSRRHAEGREASRAVMVGSLAFILGFSAVFIAAGASASAIGRSLVGFRVDLGPLTLTPAHLAGIVIMAFGLHLLGLLRIPLLYREQRFRFGGGGGVAQASLLGAAFAFGWTPCIGPVLAGILTIAAAQETVGRGVFLLTFYSLGLGIPFFLAALSLDRFFHVAERLKGHFRAIEIASGLLLVGVGALVLTGSLTTLNSYFGFMTDVVLRLEELLL